MGQVRQARKKIQAEHNDPINYTCSVCLRVHPFNSEHPYVCENDIVEENNDGGNADTASSQ